MIKRFINRFDVNRVLPREVAQVLKGPNDTRFYGVGSGDVGKELPRNKSVVCVSFVGGLAQKHRRKCFQDTCSFRVYTLGSTIVVRDVLHSTPPFLRLERVIRSRRG